LTEFEVENEGGHHPDFSNVSSPRATTWRFGTFWEKRMAGSGGGKEFVLVGQDPSPVSSLPQCRNSPINMGLKGRNGRITDGEIQ